MSPDSKLQQATWHPQTVARPLTTRPQQDFGCGHDIVRRPDHTKILQIATIFCVGPTTRVDDWSHRFRMESCAGIKRNFAQLWPRWGWCMFAWRQLPAMIDDDKDLEFGSQYQSSNVEVCPMMVSFPRVCTRNTKQQLQPHTLFSNNTSTVWLTPNHYSTNNIFFSNNKCAKCLTPKHHSNSNTLLSNNTSVICITPKHSCSPIPSLSNISQ